MHEACAVLIARGFQQGSMEPFPALALATTARHAQWPRLAAEKRRKAVQMLIHFLTRKQEEKGNQMYSLYCL